MTTQRLKNLLNSAIGSVLRSSRLRNRADFYSLFGALVTCYNQKNRNSRKDSDRFKSFSYDELTKRDKFNLDI